jgi:hypothetical protein
MAAHLVLGLKEWTGLLSVMANSGASGETCQGGRQKETIQKIARHHHVLQLPKLPLAREGRARSMLMSAILNSLEIVLEYY